MIPVDGAVDGQLAERVRLEALDADAVRPARPLRAATMSRHDNATMSRHDNATMSRHDKVWICLFKLD
jgi:hypothetical protein